MIVTVRISFILILTITQMNAGYLYLMLDQFAKDTLRLRINVFQPQQLGDRTWAQLVMQVLKTANDCAFEIARLEVICGEIH